jgi:hypothetical protein
MVRGGTVRVAAGVVGAAVVPVGIPGAEEDWVQPATRMPAMTIKINAIAIFIRSIESSRKNSLKLLIEKNIYLIFSNGP